MLAEDFEDQIEELHQRYADGDIDRDLQSSTRSKSPNKHLAKLPDGRNERVWFHILARKLRDENPTARMRDLVN